GEAHLVLARVQDELGELERADTAYTAAIASLQRQPDSAPALARAYRHYGKFLKRLGRAEAALEAFELAADLAPSNQDALAPLPQSGVDSRITAAQYRDDRLPRIRRGRRRRGVGRVHLDRPLARARGAGPRL